jgi:DNA (cytosine-5)-methyltransferase 1
MTRPRLLDLFCGAGGAAVGYHRAGFDIVGVDNRPQPNYPFEFHQGEAMTFPLAGFDAIHASPPCQAYSIANNLWGKDHPRLIEPVRERLLATELPYVIENVPGSPLRSPYLLCGLAFGLGIKRHRLFETNIGLLVPACPYGHRMRWITVFGNDAYETTGRRDFPSRRRVPIQRGYDAMGIDWMNRDELSEAIPPAYTQWIGEQLLAHLEAAA